ncbi:ring-cleaving dioxygenase [Bacillus sp. CECT 9360]|uniref:ring-cleaving dioxygenase n=1 Tax=Bacillus sp. CECT 9360 TaxID=2845821 RepID=UPI001E2BC8EF|nr:ring-cleaving dioxygenase [Bacillus sp. CECT 9360]CAH0347125.1 Putative ring-cleaving dioxygenase MhqO [Bacillus sp. CECT 9360]
MKKQTTGIHHITAIVGNPQENVDFYAGVLGLRLVKKTVNFDDPGTYHLYFGNEAGSPGTIITFFPWPNAYKGKIGSGQVGIISYVVQEGTLSFWERRLKKFKVAFEKRNRFGEDYLAFEDPHGLQLELVARKEGTDSKWSFGGVSAEVAIKGFGGAVLLSANPEKTMTVLTNVMGLDKVGDEDDLTRFRTADDIGNIIDVSRTKLPPGSMGVGTVHHIAWRADDFGDHESWRQYLDNQGYRVTPIIDRQYFNAVYFREEGGILFEIATDPPGFTRDESAEEMGKGLLLPPWLEERRPKLERTLLPAEARVLKEDLE